MFDVFGVVSDAAQDYFADYPGIPFPKSKGVILDAESEFRGMTNDWVRVGAILVTLDSHLYHIFELRDGDLERRPDDFALRYLVPAIKAVAENYAAIVEGATVIATRAAKQPVSPDRHGGGLISMNGVQLRWFVDYDSRILGDRLIVDVYVGTFSEETVNV